MTSEKNSTQNQAHEVKGPETNFKNALDTKMSLQEVRTPIYSSNVFDEYNSKGLRKPNENERRNSRRVLRRASYVS